MGSRLLPFIDGLSRVAGAFGALLFVGIAVLILAEIFMRVALNVSLTFAWEYSTYFTAVGIFCGAAYTLRTGGHVRVTLLSTKVSPRTAHAIDVLCTLFAIWMVGTLAYAMTEFALRALAAGSRSPTVVAVPLVIPSSGVALGAILLLLQLLARLTRLLIGEAPEEVSALETRRVD